MHENKDSLPKLLLIDLPIFVLSPITYVFIKTKNLFARAAVVLLIVITSFFIASEAQGVSLLDNGGLNQKAFLSSPRGYLESIISRSVGDVITVRVVENVRALKEADIDTLTDVDHDADFNFKLAMVVSSSLTPTTNDNANMTFDLTVPVDYGRDSSRSITVNNRENFTTLVSALIIEVDPESGNMVLEGSRQIMIEGQTKSLYLRGIANSKDIDANNEIPSYKLANAQVQIIGSGALTKERDNGVLQRIFRKLF